MAKQNRSTYRIGIYIRVSTEEQAQNLEGSIKNQEQRLRSHIDYKNQDSHFGDLVEVFIDRAMSGKDTNRLALQRMLQAIRKEEINFVMATELSRISRSIKDFSEIWEMMQKHSCGFLSLRENFDSSTAAGEMMLFSMANLAQFERKQTAERVSQNFKARSKRGLYNGGSVPFGYELTPGKPGFLRINQEHAQVIKKCFETFLKFETLSRSARELNYKGYRLQKYMQGGGRYQRLDHFTVDNLHHILTNKVYKGVKAYKEHGEEQEAKAVWKGIINETLFDRVGEILAKNKSRKKPHSKERYPYLLSGICFCRKCGGNLSGKSAWGSSGKVPYYEHSWSTKKGSTLTQRSFDCGNPRRFSGKILERLVCEKVLEILSGEHLAKKLFEKAHSVHLENKAGQDIKRAQSQIYGYNSQMDALAERLAQLPKSVSATSLFKQMEKIEDRRKQAEALLQSIKQGHREAFRKPAELQDFLKFTKSLREIFQFGDAPVKEKIIKHLIHKIEVNPDEVTLHFIVDQDFYPKGTHNGPPIFLCPKSKKVVLQGAKASRGSKHEGLGIKKAPDPEGAEALDLFFNFFSSNSLTFGALRGT